MRALGLFLLVFAACDPIAPSGDINGLVEPRPVAAGPNIVTRAAPAPVPAVVEPREDIFDFEADGLSDDGPPTDVDVDVMAAMGVDADTDVDSGARDPMAEDTTDDGVVDGSILFAEQGPPVEPAPVAAGVAETQQNTGSQRWNPSQPVGLGFSVRLVSTTAQSQPPRAILGLADGREVVVEPGTMLPDAHLVVLAIGEDVVQVAEITAMGDRARVESRMLNALYRQKSDRP